MPHGAQKLFGLLGGNFANFERFFGSLGFQPAAPFVILVGCVEFFGGLMIALGLFTRPVAVMATISTGIAALMVHLPKGFFAASGGVEFPLIWAVALLFFAVHGGGRFSLDRMIGREF
jgi:putative oxidoreductase